MQANGAQAVRIPESKAHCCHPRHTSLLRRRISGNSRPATGTLEPGYCGLLGADGLTQYVGCVSRETQ